MGATNVSEALIAVGVTLALGRRALLRDVSFRVEPGERLAVMGPSGSGKSSLLAFIGGHLDRAFAASGRVYIGEREVTDLPAERRRIGLMFQDDLLFPHLSVGANLAFGLDPAVRGRAKRRARVAEALKEAGLAGFQDRNPATLSGGQRQQTAHERDALASLPVIIVTHDPADAEATGGRTLTIGGADVP
jgi:putative thiamine transport system ATP-binding protein